VNREIMQHVQRIESGELSRNRHFDLFRRRSYKQAKVIHSRLSKIEELSNSGHWKMTIEKRGSGKTKVTMTSALFSASWQATLSALEWSYLCQKSPAILEQAQQKG